MKYQLTIIILWICLSNYCYSQDTISYSQKRQFLTDNRFKLTPSQIITNFRPAENWIKHDIDFEDDPISFESAFNLNVFDYFDLNKTYDSDLKKEVFKQNSKYKTLFDSLKKIKVSYLNSVYYEEGFNEVGGENFDSDQAEQVNYDIKKKGFFIGIGEVLPYHCTSYFCPKVIEDVEFKQLSITKKYNCWQSTHSYTQYLFIPMDAESALEIENNRNKIQILRVFAITGLYFATFNDADFIADNINEKTCKVKVVKGGNMRLLIYNKETGKIYFDKLYPSQSLVKK